MTFDPSIYSGALILVVDDEQTQRLLTRDNLEGEGFRVEEAADGEEGLRQLRALKPDLVLLDVMMPGIDGFEVCRRLRADPNICHTPVIIVTGREDTEDIRKGFAAGATDFMTKPVIWNLLPNRVRYVLRTSQMERELRDAKAAAEKANHAKSTLLSTMGHELRTPLNAIIGFSDLMTLKTFGPVGSPQNEEFVADIRSSGMRLLNAINSVLEIVNCESSELELNQQEIDVCGLALTVMQEVVPEAQASGVQIINEVPDDDLRVRGDEQRLRQAWYNLVSNAVRFTKKGGVVRLQSAHSAQGNLILSVADNGIGIAADDLPRILEPFEQADNDLARKYEGLGLGIPLAIAMTRLHGGDIEFESEPGRGTTARITLPAERVVTAGTRTLAPRIA